MNLVDFSKFVARGRDRDGPDLEGRELRDIIIASSPSPLLGTYPSLFAPGGRVFLAGLEHSARHTVQAEATCLSLLLLFFCFGYFMMNITPLN